MKWTNSRTRMKPTGSRTLITLRRRSTQLYAQRSPARVEGLCTEVGVGDCAASNLACTDSDSVACTDSDVGGAEIVLSVPSTLLPPRPRRGSWVAVGTPTVYVRASCSAHQVSARPRHLNCVTGLTLTMGPRS